MSTPLVVAITLGSRDLQVLVVDQDDNLRRVTPKNVGPFHQALLPSGTLAGKYCFWLPDAPDAAPDEEQDSRKLAVELKDGEFFVKPAGRFATRGDLPGAASESNGRLWLMPGILCDKLLELRAEIAAEAVQLERVILFHTERNPDSYWGKQEPRAAAPLLKEWLTDWLPVDRAAVTIVNYVEGLLNYEVSDSTGNLFLDPKAAQAIDDALREAAEHAPNAVVRLHDSGGIPVAGEVLRASARQRFHNEVQYRQPSEGHRRGPPRKVLEGHVHSAVDLLEARRRACALVRSGKFAAAADLAREFTTDENDSSGCWQRALETAALFFNGYANEACSKTRSFPDMQISGPITRAAPRTPVSLHVAMRAEAALRANDIMAAGLMTVTFYDAALRDGLRLAFGNACVDPNTDGLRLERTKRSADAWLRFANAELYDLDGKWKVNWLRPPRETIDWWIFRNGNRNAPFEALLLNTLWRQYVAIRAIGGFRRTRRKISDSLSELFEQVHRESREGRRPADFRHLVAHSMPTQKEIEDAAKLFPGRQLWYKSRNGCSFLFKTKPAAVLAALGIADPQDIYQNLVNALIADVENCPLYA